MCGLCVCVTGLRLRGGYDIDSSYGLVVAMIVRRWRGFDEPMLECSQHFPPLSRAVDRARVHRDRIQHGRARARVRGSLWVRTRVRTRTRG